MKMGIKGIWGDLEFLVIFFLRDQLAALPVGFIIKNIGKSSFSKFCKRSIYISLIYSKLSGFCKKAFTGMGIYVNSAAQDILIIH